jgi:ABC-type glycerol-3-phosphate transport system substrate-binding protein
MMGAHSPAKALHQAPRFRLHRGKGLLLSLLCGFTLVGCSAPPQLPNLIYLAIGTNTYQTIDAELVEDLRNRINLLGDGYRQINPATHFQFALYSKEQIIAAMRRRNRAGLGPDLMFVNGHTALRLVEQGLVDPFPLTPDLANLFNAGDLKRMRTGNGALAGLPILIQTQVACFNRKRLPNPPTSLEELLSASAQGNTIGLSVDLTNLFWTAGSIGALNALNRAAVGAPLNPEERRSIFNWLAWLQNAGNQRRVTFYGNASSTLQEFKAGRLDWIPCDSVNLPRLRKSLGPALGVASLPGGPGGQASPVNHLRVLALGRSSSESGRKRALAFSRFSVNPLVQRSLTLGSQTVLPANRFVQVPVQSSRTLAAIVDSQRAGERSSTMVNLLQDDDPRIAATQSLIAQLVFGEVSPLAATDGLIRLFKKQR